MLCIRNFVNFHSCLNCREKKKKQWHHVIGTNKLNYP